jgi:hypothetical protein
MIYDVLLIAYLRNGKLQYNSEHFSNVNSPPSRILGGPRVTLYELEGYAHAQDCKGNEIKHDSTPESTTLVINCDGTY